MHTALTTLSALLFFLHSSIAVQLPSSFKKCNRKEANFNQCLATAVTDAFHQLDKPHLEIGLPSIEPSLSAPHVTVPAGKAVLLFEQKYKNFSLHGLSRGKVSKINVNFAQKTIYLQTSYQELLTTFDYDYDGNLLQVPIRGSGPGHFIGKNVTFSITFQLEEYEKQGEKYFKVTNTDFVLEEPELIIFNFHNLVRIDVSDDDLSPNQLFNQNWVKIFHDNKSGFEDFLGTSYGALFNSFLGNVPISEIFGDE